MADPPEPTAFDEEFETWFRWADRIRAIAQTGLAFATDVYDRERYAELREMAADCLSRLTSIPRASLQKLFAEINDPTPKIEVRAVVFQEGRVLLVRERDEALWALPGGWADIGYSPGAAAAKEVFEESGYIVKPRKILAMLDRSKRPSQPVDSLRLPVVRRLRPIRRRAHREHRDRRRWLFARDELPPLCASRSSRGR